MVFKMNIFNIFNQLGGVVDDCVPGSYVLIRRLTTKPEYNYLIVKVEDGGYGDRCFVKLYNDTVIAVKKESLTHFDFSKYRFPGIILIGLEKQPTYNGKSAVFLREDPNKLDRCFVMLENGTEINIKKTKMKINEETTTIIEHDAPDIVEPPISPTADDPVGGPADETYSPLCVLGEFVESDSEMKSKYWVLTETEIDLSRSYSGFEGGRYIPGISKPKGFWFGLGGQWLVDGVGCETYTIDYYKRNFSIQNQKFIQVIINKEHPKILKVTSKADIDMGIRNNLWQFTSGVGWEDDKWNVNWREIFNDYDGMIVQLSDISLYETPFSSFGITSGVLWNNIHKYVLDNRIIFKYENTLGQFNMVNPLIEYSPAAGPAAGPAPTTSINVGYDFDGVLHRTMAKYQRKGSALYQGHPNFGMDTKLYKKNTIIIDDIKLHISKGDNVFIISRNPRNKMDFLRKNSATLYRYFLMNPENIIVVPSSISKADVIKDKNITKFVEDSTSELDNIFRNTRGVELILVNTFQTYKRDDEPIMLPYNPLGVAKEEIKLLSYNVYFGSFVNGIGGHPPQLGNGINIINLINRENPDLMVLAESSPLVPIPSIGEPRHYTTIRLENYSDPKNYTQYAKKNTGGLIIYWNDKFDKILESRGYSVSNYGADPLSFSRPCIGVKLIHKNSGKIYNVIGVHLGHDMRKKKYIGAMNKILMEMSYQPGEEIIIMGDHNELYEGSNPKINNFEILGTRLELKTINNGGGPDGTCCGIDRIDDHPGYYFRPFDLAYSNIPNLRMKVLPTHKTTPDRDSDHSDHYPIVGTFSI